MDIHKPKPWHGLREFLKEYLIIVVGVLTALAAEQGVEWLHWQEQVAQADEALKTEVQFNLLSGYERVIGGPCRRERLVELRDLLLQPGPAWKAAPFAGAPNRADPKSELERLGRSTINGGSDDSAMAGIYSTPSRPWRDGAWSSALASGVFNHMGRDRAAAYGRLYRGFEGMRDQQEIEQTSKARLAPLAYDRSLSEAERTEFLQVLAAANYANLSMTRSGAQLIIDAARSGLRVKSSAAKRMVDGIAASPFAHCTRTVTIPLDPG